MKTVLLTLLGFLAALTLAGLLFIYSGLYDVSALGEDAGPVQWVLETTQKRSVHRAAESLEGKVEVPRLDDPRLIRSGFVLYHELCATCHGAPGVQISDIGQGLNPYPPELAAEAAEEDPLELFWVTRNGIKMTGMPAFGATRSDEEIWEIVAFLKRMPQLSPEEYKALGREAGRAAP